MKMARFVVDTHVHSQRTAAGAALKKKAESSSGETPSKYKYQDLAETLREVEPYDNSERLLYDMSCYGIDMCITRPSMSLGMNNELNAKLVEKYPDKFAALCNPRGTFRKAIKGEIEWTIDAALREIDDLLSTGKFVGIGEGMPIDPMVLTGKKPQPSREGESRPDDDGDGRRPAAQGANLFSYWPQHGVRIADARNIAALVGSRTG